jgi:single-stranded-DNA-specific exonuclease
VADDALLGVEASLSGRLWQRRALDERLALSLAQGLELPEIIGQLLAERGISLDDAPDFLNPTLRHSLPDPMSLRDMEVGARRLALAIKDGELIGIFGDYDVDGATSAALLQRFLRLVGGKSTVYIPDRIREGYGPNAPALTMLAEQGVHVLITVDCGISAFDALAAGAEAGLDTIVVDHHIAESRLPEAYAVINPNRLDEDGSLGQLAAVGVTFLLLVALNRVLREAGWYKERPEPDLRDLLDIVALGTVCDVVPLTGPNRALVRQGLRVMARRTNAGIAALSDIAGIDAPPGAYHAGFVLGPRVNAGGRVGESSLGVRLLSTDDPDEAREIAQKLNAFNRERQAIEADVLEAATAQVEAREPGNVPLIIAAGEGWHPGVIGIVASRLVEKFGRPAAVVAIDGETGKASCRSVPGVDFGAAITAARQAGLLINGGGHAMAAGFTVDAGRLAELGAFLFERMAGGAPSAKGAALNLDGALAVEGATLELLETIAKLGPFGSGNPEPRFAISGARLIKADVVGTGHVRCILAGKTGTRLKAIAFRKANEPLGLALLSGQHELFHFAGTLRIDHWQGRQSVQLTIQDASPAQPGEDASDLDFRQAHV